ncbi:hypothetical protein Tco_0508171 [Tanacetum coccineum]
MLGERMGAGTCESEDWEGRRSVLARGTENGRARVEGWELRGGDVAREVQKGAGSGLEVCRPVKVIEECCQVCVGGGVGGGPGGTAGADVVMLCWELVALERPPTSPRRSPNADKGVNITVSNSYVALDDESEE